MLFFVVFILTFVGFARTNEVKACIRPVGNGRAVGLKADTAHGKQMCKYLGMPYAEAPVGDLRFELPVPYRSSGEFWVKYFQEKPEMCPQPINIEKGDDSTIKGSEDCLTLSVYTPLETKNSSKLLPVFFWIHGGSFFLGSQDSAHNGFDYIVGKDVIVVSINYRLGPLGFLSIPELNMTGNLGLKDQVLALKWVQKNIASFGGNPRKVTIVGWSAGGASVTYHLYSRQSKGLFSKAISMSGTILNPWAFLETPKWCANNYLNFTGLQTKDQLKNASFIDLMLRLKNKLMYSYFGSYHFCFAPTVEAPMTQRRFLKKSPLRQTRTSPVNGVPLLIGYTNHEAEFWSPDINYYMSNMNYANKNKSISDEIQNYIQNFTENFDNDEQRRVVLRLAAIADTLFGVREFTQKYVTKSGNRVFAYRFGFNGTFGHFKPQLQKKYRNMGGAIHGDDLGYLFGPFPEDIIGVLIDENSKEVIVSQRMVQLWTNFVKYGNPTPTINDVIKTKWRPYNENNEILDINNELQLIKDPFEKDPLYGFWDEIYGCLHKCRCELLNE